MTFVTNEPTMHCCGKPKAECKCGKITNPFSPGYRPDPLDVANDADSAYVVNYSGEIAVGEGVIVNRVGAPRPLGGALGHPPRLLD